MSKNKVSLILFAFIGCLTLTMIVLMIKLGTRPDDAVNDRTNADADQEVIIQEGTIDDDSQTTEDAPEEDLDTDTIVEPEDTSTGEDTKKVVTLLDAQVNVNIRSSADTNSTILGKLGANEELEYIEDYNDQWTKVIYNGSEAYVFSSYIQVKEISE